MEKNLEGKKGNIYRGGGESLVSAGHDFQLNITHVTLRNYKIVTFYNHY